jgi:dienelactone hydrolase
LTSITRRLASLGYCAFALDLFGKGEPVTDGLRRMGEIAADLKRYRGLATAGLEVMAGARSAMARAWGPSALQRVGGLHHRYARRAA